MTAGAAFVIGAAITYGRVGTQTYVQLSTPDGVRGRALSIYGLISRGSPAVGALLLGLLGDRHGLPAVVAVGPPA